MTFLPQMTLFRQLNCTLDVYSSDVTSELTTDSVPQAPQRVT